MADSAIGLGASGGGGGGGSPATVGILSALDTAPTSNLDQGDLFNLHGVLYEHDIRHFDATARLVRLISLARRTVINAANFVVPNPNYTDLFRGFHLNAHGVGAADAGDFYFNTTYGDFEVFRTNPTDEWVGYNPFEFGEVWHHAYSAGAITEIKVGDFGVRISMIGTFASSVGINGNQWTISFEESNADGVTLHVLAANHYIVLQQRLMNADSPTLADIKAAFDNYAPAVDLRFGTEYIGGATGIESTNHVTYPEEDDEIYFMGGGPDDTETLDQLTATTWSESEAFIAGQAQGQVLAVTNQADIVAVMHFAAGAAEHSEPRNVLYNHINANIGARGYFWFDNQTERAPNGATFPLAITGVGLGEIAIFKYESDGDPDQFFLDGDSLFAGAVIGLGAVERCGLRLPLGRYDVHVVAETDSTQEGYLLYLRIEDPGADPRHLGVSSGIPSAAVAGQTVGSAARMIVTDIVSSGALIIYLEGAGLSIDTTNWRGYVMLEYKGL